jgi:hypothetical protein
MNTSLELFYSGCDLFKYLINGLAKPMIKKDLGGHRAIGYRKRPRDFRGRLHFGERGVPVAALVCP